LITYKLEFVRRYIRKLRLFVNHFEKVYGEV
jgi:hypothetical protein